VKWGGWGRGFRGEVGGGGGGRAGWSSRRLENLCEQGGAQSVITAAELGPAGPTPDTHPAAQPPRAAAPVVEEPEVVVRPRQAAELHIPQLVLQRVGRAVVADAQHLDARPVAAAAAELLVGVVWGLGLGLGFGLGAGMDGISAATKRPVNPRM